MGELSTFVPSSSNDQESRIEIDKQSTFLPSSSNDKSSVSTEFASPFTSNTLITGESDESISKEPPLIDLTDDSLTDEISELNRISLNETFSNERSANETSISNPYEWSKERVKDWLRRELDEIDTFILKEFDAKEIDGKKMMNSSREDIYDLIGKLGPTLKIFNAIEKLKRSFASNEKVIVKEDDYV